MCERCRWLCRNMLEAKKSRRANACLRRHALFPVRRRNFQQLRRTSSAFAQKSASVRKSD